MIKLGTNSIGKIYLGNNQIGKAYLGNNLVYQSNPQPVIPDGPVEWIETDGVAYINTGIIANFPVACDFEALFVGDGTMVGARKANNGDRAQLAITYNGRVDFGYASSYYNGVDISTSITNGTPVFVRCLQKYRSSGSYVSAKQQGESDYTSKSVTAFISVTGAELPLFIFAQNSGGTAAGMQPSGTRLYYCKLYLDTSFSTPVFDGIPYRYNGKCGLWDNVSNTFFGNANSSGKFIGGPSIVTE